MTYELYINDIRCDLSSNTDITLVYNSPIFADLDAIKSNGSYNIDLPITTRNRQAIQNAMRPDAISFAPYQKIPAKLYANGINIFTNGYAIITEITDVISITLVWGNIELFTQMFDTELRDLKEGFNRLELETIPWSDTTEWSNDPTEELAFFRANFNGEGIRLWVDDEHTPYISRKYIHPSISVKSVLQAIQIQTGISLEFPRDHDPLYDNLYLPLISDNGDPDWQYPPLAITNINFYKDDGEKSGGYFEFNSFVNNTDKEVTTKSHVSFVDVSGMPSFTVKVEGRRFEIDCYIATADLPLLEKWDFNVWGSKKTTSAGIQNAQLLARANCYSNIVYQGNNYVRLNLLLGSSFTVDDKDYDYDYVFFQLIPSTEIQSLSFSASVQWDIEFHGEDFNLKANYPTQFPVVVNLPDMSCGDFLQNLMNMYGLFACIVNGSNNRLRFISADSLYDNKEEGAVYNWGRKMRCNERRDTTMADAIEYSIDDWAQKNTLDYNNDKDIIDDTFGEILINNKNLDEENEIEIDFSASKNKLYPAFWDTDYEINVARVPIFEMDEDNVKETSCGDRILYLENETYTDDDGQQHSLPYLTFPDWLSFGGERGIVSRHYTALRKLLTEMKIITVRIKLSPIDLKNLDYTKPVFLDTFGSYFAIYSITMDTSGICECKLIKM